MNRVRSPKYPNFSLRLAVKQVEKIFRADRRNAIDRAVAVKHMGYSGLSGPADKTLATLMQYGLLERVGKGEIRVAETAVQILHPDSSRQRQEALRKAGTSPEVFKAINGRFPEGVSTEALRSFLVREDFMDRAIDPITKAYTDTAAYLKQEGANLQGGDGVEGLTDPSADDIEDDDGVPTTVFGGAAVGDLIQWESQGALQFASPKRVRLVAADGRFLAVEGSETGIPMDQVVVVTRGAAIAQAPTFPLAASEPQQVVSAPTPPRIDVLAEAEPYRVSLSRGGLEGIFRVESEAEADELIRAISAWKILLRSVADMEKPSR